MVTEFSVNQLRDTNRRHRPLTRARWSVILQMYSAGNSISDIAYFLRCDHTTVRWALQGMAFNNLCSHRVTSADIEKMRTMRQEGALMRQIVAAMGFSDPTVRKYLK